MITDEITVGDFFISWDFVLMNEVNSVGTEHGIVTEALDQAAKFIACTLGPCQTVGSIQKSVNGLLLSLVVANMVGSVLEDLLSLCMLERLLSGDVPLQRTAML
jgi:hypothetical protein